MTNASQDYPQTGRTSCDLSIQHQGPKGNILSRGFIFGHKPRGNKEKPNFPLIPKGMIKALLSHVMRNLRRRSDPQSATRVSRFCPSGSPIPREGAGLKSLRSLPPCG